MPPKYLLLSLLIGFVGQPTSGSAQVDENQVGSWFAYAWNTRFDNSRWGLKGDANYRSFDIVDDTEQFLVRGGVTYSPEAFNATLTLGVANNTTSVFGDSDDTTNENRVYQELLVPHRMFDWISITHRIRTEQRWIDGQDFRTRFRYNLSASIPLTGNSITPGSWYLNVYNEIFLNGEKDTGHGRRVDSVDRNRLYAGVGYALQDNLRLRFGFMQQSTRSADKGQLMFNLSQSF